MCGPWREDGTPNLQVYFPRCNGFFAVIRVDIKFLRIYKSASRHWDETPDGSGGCRGTSGGGTHSGVVTTDVSIQRAVRHAISSGSSGSLRAGPVRAATAVCAAAVWSAVLWTAALRPTALCAAAVWSAVL